MGIKLYDLKTDEVVMEVEPVDAKEILASKDCGVSKMSKKEREEAEAKAKALEGPKEGSKEWIINQLEEKGADFDKSASKADLQALLESL